MKKWKGDLKVKGWKGERVKRWKGERVKGWKGERVKGWKGKKVKGLGGDVELALLYFRHEVVLIVVKQRVRGIAVSTQINGLNANEFW